MTFIRTQPDGLLKTSGCPLGRPHFSGDLLPAPARRPSPGRGNSASAPPCGDRPTPTSAPAPCPPRGADSPPWSVPGAGRPTAETPPGPPTCLSSRALSHQPPRQTAPAHLAAPGPGRGDTAPAHQARTPRVGGEALRLRTGPADSGAEGIQGPGLPGRG